jgi:signal transduction histidine kinase
MLQNHVLAHTQTSTTLILKYPFFSLGGLRVPKQTLLICTTALIRLGLCLVLWLPFLVAAQDAIQARSYLEDSSSVLQLSDVQTADAAGRFKPYSGPLNRGYSASAFWIKLNIQPGQMPEPRNLFDSTQLGGHLILRIRPAYLDEIALYDPLEPQARPRFVGDRHSLADAQYRSLNHNFVIPAGTQPRVIWLRLKTNSSNLMHVEALPFSEIMTRDRHQDLWSGVFIGSLLLFLAWAVLHWLTYKEGVVGALAVNQFVALLFSLSVLGYVRLALADHVPVAWIDLSTSVLALSAATTNLYFNTLFLREFKPAALGLRLLLGMLAMFPIGLLLIFTGNLRTAMQLNVLMVMVQPLLFFLIALTGKVWGLPDPQPAPLFSKRVLLWFYAAVLGPIALFALPMLGLTGGTEIALQTNSLGGFFSGLILVATLHFRAKRILQMHHEGQLGLKIAQAQIDQEKQHRQAQSQQMAMLTHELKTPLSVSRMALGIGMQSVEIKDRADRAVRDINTVIDRSAWSDRLQDGHFSLTLVAFDLAQEIEQIKAQINNPARVGLTVCQPTPSLVTDAASLRMILSNLIENALKYSPAESRVEVEVAARAQAQKAGLCVSVTNLPGAAGWPDPAHVFEKYYRSPGAYRQTGSGLGLYLAATMARQLGGELMYVSDQQSVRFELWLPV